MIFNTNTKQISFVIVFLFAFINSCLANENVDFFSSSGIKVNLSFSNETDIRNTAISKAEEIAFKRVSVKLLTPEDYKKLSKLKDIDISYFVESIEFVDEKISTETYLGEFNIYFSPFRIKEFYKSNSLTFSEVSSQNITVNVAFSNSNQFFILFNLWNTEWKKIKNIGNKINLDVKTFSQTEMGNTDLSNFLENKDIEGNNLNDENDIILIWCSPIYEKLNELRFDLIIKFNLNQKEKIIRKSYLTDYSLFRDDIFSPLIEDIKNELLLTWIDLTKQSDEVYRFKFVYDIENISDWVELQNRLQSVRLLEQYKPSLFTTDKVEGYVDFLGNGDKFVLLLSQNKINAVNLGPYYRISLDDLKFTKFYINLPFGYYSICCVVSFGGII